MYAYDANYIAQLQKESNWSWTAEAFGDVGDDALRRQAYALIVDRARALFSAGALDQASYNRMTLAAGAGALMYPALTDAMAKDSIAKTAWYKMMADSGLWALRQQVRSAVKKAVLADAQTLAANEAMWNAITVPMEYISGAKAIEKLGEYLGKIRSDVNATNAMLSEAKRTLSAERYQAVAAEASGINAQITYLEKYLPEVSQDTGTVGLAWVQAAVAIAIGVAIGIAAVAWAYVQSKKAKVAGKLTEMAEAQRSAEAEAARAKAAAIAVAADAAVAEGKMTPAQAATVKAQAVEQAQTEIIAAGSRAAAAAEQAGSAMEEGGLFGIDFKWLAIGGIALVGLIALPQVLAMFPKSRPAQG